MDTMTMTIRVSAIEDDARYRESLAALFTHAPGFSWGGSFARPSDALEAVAVGIARGEEQPWDLMLMDLGAPLVAGQPFVVTLTFERSGTREVDVEVLAPDQAPPTARR